MDTALCCDNNQAPTLPTQYTYFLWAGTQGSPWASTTPALRQSVVAIAGRLTNFRIKLQSGPAVGNTWTYTVWKNGSVTDMTVTLNAGETTAADLVHTISLSPGDTLSLEFTGSLPFADTLAKGSWSARFVGDNPRQSFITGNNSAALSATLTQYVPAQGGGTPSSTAAAVETLFPTAGTLRNFYVRCGAAPGSGRSFQFTLYKNGSPTGITATVSGTNQTASDVVNSVTVAAGDRLYWEAIPSGSPVANSRSCSYSLEFDPTVDGESVQCAGSANVSLSNSAVRYLSTAGVGSPALTLNESSIYTLADRLILRKFHGRLSADPTVGGSNYQFQLSVSTVGGNPSFTIAAGSTTGSDTTNEVGVFEGETLSYKITPSGSPTAVACELACVTFIEPWKQRTMVIST